jgi:hypothetical protein
VPVAPPETPPEPDGAGAMPWFTDPPPVVPAPTPIELELPPGAGAVPLPVAPTPELPGVVVVTPPDAPTEPPGLVEAPPLVAPPLVPALLPPLAPPPALWAIAVPPMSRAAAEIAMSFFKSSSFGLLRRNCSPDRSLRRSQLSRNRLVSATASASPVRSTVTPCGKALSNRLGKRESSITKTPRSSARRIKRP